MIALGVSHNIPVFHSKGWVK